MGSRALGARRRGSAGGRVRRVVGGLVTAAVVSAGLAVAPALTAPAAAAALLNDGGFENATGSPPDSPSWTEADNQRSSPLCSTSSCNGLSPHSGTKWAAFGGSSSSASLTQRVTIPSGGSATLTYWFAKPYVSSPNSATLRVQIDGNTLNTQTEGTSAQSGYSQQTVQIPSTYLNGASHTVGFVYANSSPGQGVHAMFVDDVALTYTAVPTTATPTVSSVSPASPATSTTPTVKGTAETGSTVTLYANSSCTGTALGSGPAATFAGTGIAATVPANATTTIYAKATKTGQNASACSSTSVAYTNDQTAPAVVTFTSPAATTRAQSTKPVIKGTAESGSTVKLYTNACTGTPVATGTATAFSSTGFAVTVAAGSTTTFRATATDAAGNTSACSTSTIVYTQDSSAPAGLTLSSTTPGSPGASTSPTVTGTAENGATVRIYLTSGCTGTATTTTANATTGAFSVAVTVPANATTTFRATATDSAGNVSACSTSSLSYTQDSVKPATVQLTGVTPTSPNPITTPVVRGTAEAGSTVRLYNTSTCTGTPLATGSAEAFAAPGLAATVTLGSTTAFRATTTDAAGNASTCSSALSYKADLADGGFEAAATGNPAVSPSWTAADSLAGSPLVNDTMYVPGADNKPHAGKAWVWFGGYPDAGHTGSISQSAVLPNGGNVSLTFWYLNSDVSAPYDAHLLVQVDGITVRTITESSTPGTDYSKQTVDISAFADGAGHVLTLAYANGGEGVTNMLVDDLSLSPVSGARVATPSVSGVSPASGTTLTPLVTGTAEGGSSVVLYASASCTGAPIGSGSAATFGGGGVPVTVPAATTTAIYAKATAAGRDDSACSTTAASYTALGPPDTTLTKTPKHKVKIRKKKAKIAFAFSSPTAGATFQCSIDGGAFKACAPGVKYKLKPGSHPFAVRAVANGMADPTPATWTVKVKRKKRP